MPVAVAVLLLVWPLLRERAESVTVGAFDLPAVNNPATVTAREPVYAREESRRERVERSSHGRRGKEISR
jgi:hypothetical protein